MPWKIEKRDEEHCVIKVSDGSAEGCHPTRQEAEDHMSALYASEDGKELTVSDRISNFLADHLKQEAPKKTIGGKKFPAGDFACVPDRNKPSTWKLPMTKTPGGGPDIGRLSAAAAAFSSGGHRGQKVQLPSTCPAQKVKAKLRGAYRKIGKEPPDSLKEHDMEEGTFFFKDAEGLWRWVGVTSNNWQDKDEEWLSEKSHRRFEEMIDSGEYVEKLKDSFAAELPFFKEAIETGMPGAWVWHTPVPVGITEMIAFDERGYLVSSGRQKEGDLYSKVFESLSKLPPGELGMSHMMPTEFVIRNKDDSRIIDEYLSTEFTFLPIDKAANAGTMAGAAFIKEAGMKIEDRKRDWFESTFGEEVVSQFDALLNEFSMAADEADVDRKETVMELEKQAEEQKKPVDAEEEEDEEEKKKKKKVPAEGKAETEEVETEEVDAEEEETEDDEDADTGMGMEEFVLPTDPKEFVTEVVRGVKEPFDLLMKEFQAVSSRMDQLEAQVKEVAENEDARLAAKAKETPLASIGDIIARSVVGNEQARPDISEKNLYSGPEEATEPGANRITGNPVADMFISEQRSGRRVIPVTGNANGS